MTGALEVESLGHGFVAVYIPRGLDGEQERLIRQRLGLICRHGRYTRAATGRCAACAIYQKERSA